METAKAPTTRVLWEPADAWSPGKDVEKPGGSLLGALRFCPERSSEITFHSQGADSHPAVTSITRIANAGLLRSKTLNTRRTGVVYRITEPDAGHAWSGV